MDETTSYNNIDDVVNFFDKNKYIIIFILLSLILFIISKNKNNNKNNYLKDGMNNKIPRVIYQTYINKNIPNVVKERWMKLNPDFKYYLYDNDDCSKFLLEEYGKDYSDLFNKIKDGPIKSDFWRLCILYKYGGIYADIDIIPHVPINEIVYSDTTLYTCVTAKTLGNNLNPHFIAVEARNPLILKCINVYMNTKRYEKYSYSTYSITYIMRDVMREYFNIYEFHEGIYKKNDQIVQFSIEICPEKGPHAARRAHIEQNDKTIMENRDNELYDMDKHKFK
tara:strand:- start:91 stop:930 length:840 start_codon:yes stop_codon:yes gene_type:complete